MNIVRQTLPSDGVFGQEASIAPFADQIRQGVIARGALECLGLRLAVQAVRARIRERVHSREFAPISAKFATLNKNDFPLVSLPVGISSVLASERKVQRKYSILRVLRKFRQKTGVCTYEWSLELDSPFELFHLTLYPSVGA